MTMVLSIKAAQQKIRELLIGGSIRAVEYYGAGWKLWINHPKADEWILEASEIVVPESVLTFESLADLQIDLKDTNDPDDTLTAIVIFTISNTWPIVDALIDDVGNLTLAFQNGCRVQAPAIVEYVDWTWIVSSTLGKQTVMTCDSGDLYGNEEFFT